MPRERRPEDRPPIGSEDWWRTVLTSPEANFEPFRNIFLRLPSAPHCKLCGAPFKGPGGFVLGPLGFRPWEKNPTMCRACIQYSSKVGPGGAEVPCTLLFADVRGSTGLAEHATATDFAALVRRFYAVGSQAVIDQRGIVDRYVGDEVAALFIPAFSGPMHARAAMRSARQLLAATGYGTATAPWLEIGIGIHSGPAFVGTVAVGSEVTDFTALGDTVNAAARLASEAHGGELLVTEAALELAGIQLAGTERRELALRGREAPIAIRVLRLAMLVGLQLD